MAIPGLGNFGNDMADWPRHYSGGDDDASDASRRRRRRRRARKACDTLICGRQPPPDGR